MELLLPIVRSTYCGEFARLSQVDLAPRLPCPLDLRLGLPVEQDPISKGLSPATRAFVARDGYRNVLSNLGDLAEIGPQGNITVKTELIKQLWRLLYMKEASVRCPAQSQATMVNAVNRIVQGSAGVLTKRYVCPISSLYLAASWLTYLAHLCYLFCGRIRPLLLHL